MILFYNFDNFFKIEKQLEYIKLSFNLEILRNRSGSGLQNTRIINDKANQLNDMYNFMKQENIMYLKKQEEIAEAIKRTSELEAAEKSKSFIFLNIINCYD